MNRTAIGLDRVLGTVVGVVLIVAGVAGIGWWQGVLTRRAPALGAHTHGALLAIRTGTTQLWWPWVAGIVGLVLGLLGVLWLLRHAAYHGVRSLRLKGSTRTGALTAATGPLFTAAGDELARVPGVRRAVGGLTTERGSLVAELRLTVDPAADLAAVAAGVDRIVIDLATALDNPDVTYRAVASVARRTRVDA